MSIASAAVILWVARVQNKKEGAFIIATDALFVHVQRRHPCAVLISCILNNVQFSPVRFRRRGQQKRHESARPVGAHIIPHQP